MVTMSKILRLGVLVPLLPGGVTESRQAAYKVWRVGAKGFQGLGYANLDNYWGPCRA